MPLLDVYSFKKRDTYRWGLFSFFHKPTESKPSHRGRRSNKASLFFLCSPNIRLLTARFGLKVRKKTFNMASLEESKQLMLRICNLPTNTEELKKQGFQDKDIEAYRKLMSNLDPEVNKLVKRMKELIDYKPKF